MQDRRIGSFVTPTLVWLYTIVTDRHRALKENADVKVTGKYFSTVRYVIDRANINAFRDGQEAEATSAAVGVWGWSERVFLPWGGER